jgi:hypothetical protein
MQAAGQGPAWKQGMKKMVDFEQLTRNKDVPACRSLVHWFHSGNGEYPPATVPTLYIWPLPGKKNRALQ